MNPLQNLRDIHTPVEIDFWPPAYGWWLLLFVSILLVSCIGIWLVKFRRARVVKRKALEELRQVDKDAPQSNAHLNQLLKRVAMAYFPNLKVQKMFGNQWTEFLVSTMPLKKADDFSEQIDQWQQTLYQKSEGSNPDFAKQQKIAEQWIKSALPPKSKTLEKWEKEHA